MRCLYCGKSLPLLRKLTGGGEFCSEAHRQKYQEEYNKLALSRLLQAQNAQGEGPADHRTSERSLPAGKSRLLEAAEAGSPAATAVASTSIKVAEPPKPESRHAEPKPTEPKQPEMDPAMGGFLLSQVPVLDQPLTIGGWSDWAEAPAGSVEWSHLSSNAEVIPEEWTLGDQEPREPEMAEAVTWSTAHPATDSPAGPPSVEGPLPTVNPPAWPDSPAVDRSEWQEWKAATSPVEPTPPPRLQEPFAWQWEPVRATDLPFWVDERLWTNAAWEGRQDAVSSWTAPILPAADGPEPSAAASEPRREPGAIAEVAAAVDEPDQPQVAQGEPAQNGHRPLPAEPARPEAGVAAEGDRAAAAADVPEVFIDLSFLGLIESNGDSQQPSRVEN